MRDASGQARKLRPQDQVNYNFIIQGEWGWEKTASSFLGVVAPPPQYPLRCVFKLAGGWSSNSCPRSESECRPHPIPHPMTWGNSRTSTSQESLPCSEVPLEQILTDSDLPKSPMFPSLSMVPYWDHLIVPTPSLSMILSRQVDRKLFYVCQLLCRCLPLYTATSSSLIFLSIQTQLSFFKKCVSSSLPFLMFFWIYSLLMISLLWLQWALEKMPKILKHQEWVSSPYLSSLYKCIFSLCN